MRADEEKFMGRDRTTDHLKWWLSLKDHSSKTEALINTFTLGE
jgi:hypothetical protein